MWPLLRDALEKSFQAVPPALAPLHTGAGAGAGTEGAHVGGEGSY